MVLDEGGRKHEGSVSHTGSVGDGLGEVLEVGALALAGLEERFFGRPLPGAVNTRGLLARVVTRFFASASADTEPTGVAIGDADEDKDLLEVRVSYLLQVKRERELTLTIASDSAVSAHATPNTPIA